MSTLLRRICFIKDLRLFYKFKCIVLQMKFLRIISAHLYGTHLSHIGKLFHLLWEKSQLNKQFNYELKTSKRLMSILVKINWVCQGTYEHFRDIINAVREHFMANFAANHLERGHLGILRPLREVRLAFQNSCIYQFAIYPAITKTNRCRRNIFKCSFFLLHSNYMAYLNFVLSSNSWPGATRYSSA